MTVTNSGRLTGQVLPRKTRWLAILAGCLSGLAATFVFGPFMFIFSSLLILGAVVQPRWHRPGRWLLAFGAFIQTFYSIGFVLLQEVFAVRSLPAFRTLADRIYLFIFLLVASTSVLLVAWCDVALIVDARKSRHAAELAEQHFPSVGDWIVWAIAACISVPVVYGIPAYFRLYRSATFNVFLPNLLLTVGIIGLDTALVISGIRTRRARRLRDTRRGAST